MPPPLLLDEVQYAPGLFRHLKHFVDTHPDERGSLILTGCQSFALMGKVAESLAGRSAIFSLLGLSGTELYFTDTGLAAFLPAFSTPESLWGSTMAGALWETYVIGQWLRWRDWQAPSDQLWFWQDKGGHEVDLLVECAMPPFGPAGPLGRCSRAEPSRAGAVSSGRLQRTGANSSPCLHQWGRCMRAAEGARGQVCARIVDMPLSL